MPVRLGTLRRRLKIGDFEVAPLSNTLELQVGGFTTVSHVWRRRNKRWRGLGRRPRQIQVAIVDREKPEKRTQRWRLSAER